MTKICRLCLSYDIDHCRQQARHAAMAWGTPMYRNNIMRFCQAASASHHAAGKIREGGGAMIGKRPRGFYCTREERSAIGARAAAAGLSVSRLVLDLVRDDIAERHVSGLAAEEMAALFDGLRVLAAYVRGLPDRAEDAGALQPPDSGAGGREDGETADRSGPSPSERVRLSISATGDEWAAIHEQALRHGLSRSRYLVGLLMPDAGLNAAPLPALSGVEQRAVLEGVRRISALLSETGDPGAALIGMRERLAALSDARASGLACDSGSREPCRRPLAKGDGRRVETGDVAAVFGTSPVAAKSSKRTKAELDPEEPDQGVLL